ncbi:isochorismatase family protein [Micromonospora sp. PLK6-60]|uniref:isochorismatase family protein n=1 Tax=Micromonospora sp. PLK6-60 TaxID=2873383 RepID=UPI001CA64B8F|nr:isochorismatase family protein [Micromonospora sp. PLK6-60]MBY8873295.1 isochorismatase family protein [Micromonospora sp. PLK6-60]
MSRAALVVIDVQESFRQRPIWAYASQPDIVDQVNRLVDAARRRGDLVVWVLHAEPGTGGVFDPASGHVRLIDGLAPAPGEATLVKTAHNAFTTTNLQQLLTLAGVRELAVCGIRTEQCVETTARLGHDLGYEMTFVTDATVTFPTPHRDLPADATVAEILADPRTLSTAEIVTRTEYALAGRFATIRTVAEVVGQLPADAVPAGV